MRAGLCLAGLIVSLLTISLLAAEKSIDVSAIVPKTEAEEILGEPVRNPTPLNVNGKDGYYSKCNYYGTKSGRSIERGTSEDHDERPAPRNASRSCGSVARSPTAS